MRLEGNSIVDRMKEVLQKNEILVFHKTLCHFSFIRLEGEEERQRQSSKSHEKKKALGSSFSLVSSRICRREAIFYVEHKRVK